MATYYISPTGDDSTGDGSEGNPWFSYQKAEATAASGDTIILQDATYDDYGSETYLHIRDGVTVKADSYRGATITPEDGETSFAMRFSGDLGSTDGAVTVEDIVVDGEGSVTSAIYLPADASNYIPLYRLHNILVKGGAANNILISATHSRQEFFNLEMEGLIEGYGLVNSASTSSTADQALIVSSLRLTDVEMDSDSYNVVLVKNGSNTGNTFDAEVNNVTGTVTCTDTGNPYTPFVFEGVDAPVITGWDVTITAPDSNTLNSVYGLSVYGLDANTQVSDAVISNGIVRLNAPAGYAISLGLSTGGNNYVTGGTISGMTVAGKYYADSTPHGIVIGESVTGSVEGCTVRDEFAGILASLSTNATIRGNLLFDCYGPSIYVKGITAGTVSHNTIVVSTRNPQRLRGHIHVNAQGTNTTAVTIEDNLVIVQDMSQTSGILAGYEASQGCTFRNNCYVIPDTVDLSSDIFEIAGVDSTFAEWLADANVTNDRIVQLPQAKINEIVSRYRAIADYATHTAGSAAPMRIGL